MLLMAKSKYFCVDVCPVGMKDLLCGGLGFGVRGNVTEQRACHTGRQLLATKRARFPQERQGHRTAQRDGSCAAGSRKEMTCSWRYGQEQLRERTRKVLVK